LAKAETPHVWIERIGGPEPVTPRFCTFLERKMAGRSLDLECDKERRPDYECLGGALVIEIKSLKGDPSERLLNAIAPAQERESWPKFFGQWPIEAILKNLPEEEREALRKSIFDRLARAIVTHFKKADRQISNFCGDRTDVHLRVLVLINEDFAEYDPSTISYIAQRELRKKGSEGSIRYSNIDAVLYLTERHATNMNGNVTFPITIIHGSKVADRPIPLELMRRLASRWAKWSAGTDMLEMPSDFSEFIPIDENPKQMRRQDVWEQEYRHKPYMRSWSDEDVIGLWDFTTMMTLLAFHVDPPMKVPREGLTKLMETSSHLMKEFASRGIALDRIKPTKKRNEAAIQKIAYGPVVQEWLRKQVEHID
jgi:hypothetical protein